MMSFAAFKYFVNEAFDGEPVTVEVARREQTWLLTVRSFDSQLGVSVKTTAEQCHDAAAIRAFCLATYMALAEADAEHQIEAENLRAGVGASAPIGRQN